MQEMPTKRTLSRPDSINLIENITFLRPLPLNVRGLCLLCAGIPFVKERIYGNSSDNIVQELSAYCESERLEKGQPRKIGF